MDGKNMTSSNIRLSSTEIAALWSTYMNDSMADCVLSYLIKKCEDAEVLPVLEYALHLSRQHIQTMSDLFTHENFPVPVGFTKDDVNLDAPRLFSDTFFLFYLYNLGKIGLSAYAIAQPACARQDVRQFFSECLASSAELINKSIDTMLAKGVFIRSPYIPVPEKVEFVEKQSFLTGWFGERRPLNVGEISQLYINLETSAAGKAVFMGFSQVAKSKKVREYLVRGERIAGKHLEVFSSLLMEDKLPAPMTWDDGVMSSTISPFSDKLMMFHAGLMCAGAVGNYGAAIGTSMRRDISTHFIRCISEIGLFAEDGMNLMIENGWLEKIPVAPDRRELAGV